MKRQHSGLSTAPRDDRALPWLRWIVTASALLSLAVFLYTAIHRLRVPFEFDWIEDGVLATVRHLRAGLPLYARPTPQFTPYLYTPLYLWTATALSHLTGIGYVPLRLLSLAATAGCGAVVYAHVYREHSSAASRDRHLAALIAVGLFASLYGITQGAFDTGRVDMLYLFFVLCALYATRYDRPLLAALLWVIAFQTKQGVLPVAVLALCTDWQRPRRCLLAVGLFFAALGASVLWMTHATHGWYRYYVFGMAGSYGYNRPTMIRFLPIDLGSVCGIALLIIVAAILFTPPSLRGRATSFYVLSSLGMVGFTGYLRAHRGANVNSLLPAYVWIALIAGVACSRLFAQTANQMAAPGHSPVARRYARAGSALLLLAVEMQLAAHFYTPDELLPTSHELAARQAFEAQLRQISSPVLVLSHPEYAVMAGGPLYAGSESIGSVIGARHHAEGDDLIAQYAALVSGGTLNAIVLDYPAETYLALPRSWMPADFLARYPLRVAALGAADGRFTSQPQWIYLPCRASRVAQSLALRVDLTPCAGASPSH